MRQIAVIDLETDPFEYGKMIQPFCGGFYDGERFASWWSGDCVGQIVDFLKGIEFPLIVYAHNGGRFDFFYFLKYLSGDLQIINNRIVRANLGAHELRDSYAIMPFPLEQYHKTPIDYETFRPGVREKHRDEIISYLRDDCVDLHTLCTSFSSEFGDALTIGSASLRQLKKFHKFSSGNAIYDAKFRNDFYFGGRNQVFKSGIIKRPIRVYDVNSMYASVMRDCLHPIGTGIITDSVVRANTAFVVVNGRNDGAFPVRAEDGSLDFTKPYGTFHATIHEFNAALETGSFRPNRIIKTMGFLRLETFNEFVSHFYDARAKAKKDEDKIRTLFYKFVLNSAYGKFAQNPENYFDWRIAPIGELFNEWHTCEKSCTLPCPLLWSPSFMNREYIIWKRPIQRSFYYNIATGASITGAARAVLLRGLRAADSPLYCDTDSIICGGLSSVKISDTELGAWKLETTGSMAAICGKKLYAIFDETGACVKKAHKGARLTGEEILQIARGKIIENCNPVPAFKFDGTHAFTKRKIRRTATV